MENTSREELRRLALWLSRRRAVDEAVEILTASGPAAVERVHSHLQALSQLLVLEQEAFAAVAAAAPAVPQSPLPDTFAPSPTPLRSTPGASVHSLSAARRRSSG